MVGQTDNTIGPGRYNHLNVSNNLKNNKPKGGVIGRDPKYHKDKNVNPGPGSYTPMTNLIKSRQASTSIGRANMYDDCRGEVIPQGFGSIKVDQMRSNELGPGQYNP